MDILANRRRFMLPDSQQLAMDTITIGSTIPADIFAEACQRLWATVASPTPPDFAKAVQTKLDLRREVATKIRTMETKLRGRTTLTGRGYSRFSKR
jgi:hypothetical protein